MSEVFPPELTDQIIGYVDKWDKETLRNCALVSRKWLPASRCALFHVIELRPRITSALELLISRILHSDIARPYLAEVREIDVHGDPRYPTLNIRDVEAKPISNACHLFLYHFSGHLPGLERLSLARLDWTLHNTPCPHEPLLFSQFPSLRFVYLNQCRFQSFSFLRRALVAIPHLEQLTFLFVTWKPTDQPPIFPHITTRPELRTLVVSHDSSLPGLHARWFLRWLSHTRSVQSLRDLKISGRDVLDSSGNLVPALLEFLEVTSPHLRKLWIPLAKDLPLARFCQLEYLELRLKQELYRSWTALCAQLREIQSPLLRLSISSIISLECGPQVVGLRMDDAGIGEFDTMLTELKHLREIRLGVAVKSTKYDLTREDPEILRSVQARLPKSHKREGFHIQTRVTWAKTQRY